MILYQYRGKLRHDEEYILLYSENYNLMGFFLKLQTKRKRLILFNLVVLEVW